MDLFCPSARDRAIDVLHAATAIYTAEPVVQDLLSRVDWPRGERRLVDPSCGDGIFLGQALERLLDGRPTVNDSQLVDLLEGWEIHPHAAEQSRSRLARVLVGHGRSPAKATAVASRLVRNDDFLTAGPIESRYDVIAGNPPYMRYVNVPELLRDEYLALLPGHAVGDLLHSFLDRCAASLRPDGEIALVTADRWLFNMGASSLRSVLGERLAIHHLQRLDASTAFYRPKQRRAGTPPRIHPIAVVLRQPMDGSRLLTKEPIYPDDLGSSSCGEGPKLGDIAEVRLAPWLGSAGIFVVDSATASHLPSSHLVPAMDTDDIVDGKLVAPQRFAIRTIPDVEPPAAIMEHLRRNLGRMAARGRRKQEWLPPETWHRLPLDRPALVVPRIAKSLRPVKIAPGILPINHNLHVVSAGTSSLDEIEALLCSPGANAWVRAHAAPLENGYYSLTTTLLRKLPTSC